jgi:hypothetical protein
MFQLNAAALAATKFPEYPLSKDTSYSKNSALDGALATQLILQYENKSSDLDGLVSDSRDPIAR